jgi:hypothetical protein
MEKLQNRILKLNEKRNKYQTRFNALASKIGKIPVSDETMEKALKKAKMFEDKQNIIQEKIYDVDYEILKVENKISALIKKEEAKNKKLEKKQNAIIKKNEKMLKSFDRMMKKIEKTNKSLERKLFNTEVKYKKVMNTDVVKEFNEKHKDRFDSIYHRENNYYSVQVKIFRLYGEKLTENDKKFLNRITTRQDSTGNYYYLVKQGYYDIYYWSDEQKKMNLKPYEFYNQVDNEEMLKHIKRALLSNKNFRSWYDNTSGYIGGVEFQRILRIPNIQEYLIPNYSKRIYMNDGNKNAIYNKYIKYSIDKNAKFFEELIKVDYNDYIQNNFRKNSCFLTAIINRFYNRFNMIKSDGKRAYKELTYSRLCEILGIEEKPENMGLCIELAVNKFFIPFKLGLDCYDIFMNIVYTYRPDLKNKNCDAVLKIMVHDDHVYELNNNLHSLAQTKPEDLEDIKDLQVSNKYNIIEYNEDKINIHLINNIEDIKDKILLFKDTKEDIKLKLICNKPLDDIVMDVYKSGYTPKINFDGGNIKSFFIEVANIKVNVENVDIRNPDDNDVYVDTIEEYNKYHVVNKNLYQKIFKREYLSDFHPSVITINDTYSLRPVCGHFEHTDDKLNGLDEQRAYTEGLMNIKKIPVFQYFDIYKKYDGQEIKSLCYYLVECNDTKKEAGIILSDKYSLIFGFVLKAVKNTINYKILYYLEPSNIEEVDFKTPIEEVYKSDIPDHLKKSAVNIVTGLLEKKYNKVHITKAFNDINDAIHYKTKYDGKFIPLYKYKYGSRYDPIDDTEILDGNNIQDVDKLFLVNIYKEQRLENGFNPIKDIIYSKQKLKMYLLYKKLKSLGIKPMGIKTDCILYKGNTDIVKKNFDMSKGIGKYKIEHDKSIMDTEIKVYDNELINIPDFETPLTMTLKDEYDTNEINKIIDQNKTVLFKGLYPGVGKSTACKNYDKDLLIVLPYNKQCKTMKKEGYNAITFNKLFGLYGDDQAYKNMKKYNLEGINTVLFDECFLYKPKRLRMIDQFIKSNPDMVILGTGDLNQRNPVGYNNEQYLNQCINIVFNNQIVLKEIKRLKKEEDKLRWKELKNDIFNMSLNIVDIIKKHKLNTIHSMSELKTVKNVSYFNEMRAEKVNKYVHFNILKNTADYFEGLEIVCKKYYKCKQYRLNVNYSYIIKKMNKDNVIIEDDTEGTQYKITYQMLRNYFKYPYCFTCDSIQGLSFEEDDKITIFDANNPYCDRKFLWTAITRCRYLDNVYIYIHSQDEIQRFTDMKYNQHFRFKVEGYKNQDKKKGREYNEEEYISNNWIFEQLEKHGIVCPYCNTQMNLGLDDDNNVTSNITVDRIDNSKAHIKTNCRLSCHQCNVTKK